MCFRKNLGAVFFLLIVAGLGGGAAAVSAQSAAELARGADAARLKREQVITYGRRYVGTRYLPGGDDTMGMDATGFVATVMRDGGDLRLPRDVISLLYASTVIDPTEREPGDLVFFRLTGMTTDHVGIYIGNSQFLHSMPGPSDDKNYGVRIDDMSALWWRAKFAEIRRVLPSAKNPVTSTVAPGPPVNAPESPAYRFDPIPEDSELWPLPPVRTVDDKSDSWWSLNMKNDMSFTFDWSVLSSGGAVFYGRGGSFMSNWRYEAEVFTFGFGIGLTLDMAMSVARIPLVFSVLIADDWEVYVGPVFSVAWFDGIDRAELPEKSGEPAKPSLFPGVIGLAWHSSYIPVGDTWQLAIIQDVHFSVYTSTDGRALGLLDAFASGLTFSTGVSLRKRGQ
jgi:lipoprotein Spr/probable lipoprotein NlpC